MPPSAPEATSRRIVWTAVFLVAGVLWLSVMAHIPQARAFLVQGDNDDILRWMSVQAWLGGQGWFDMTQYRVEPPDGLSMHWSRYLDAAIGSFQMAMSAILPEGLAEAVTLALWPNLLLLVLLGLVARATYRSMGPVAAVIALLFLMTWMPIRGITFVSGRIDHHNVQIILTTTVALAMIATGRPLVSGAVAGMAAAFSLAIGLETLMFIALAGMILAARAAFDAANAWPRLLGFCLALPVAGVIFFIGQTAPQDWATPHCDALATPALAVMAVASVSCLVAYGLRNRVTHPVLRLALIAGVSVAGLVAFGPLLRPCLAGPYGMLPPEAQEFITTYISEALPAAVFAAARPLTFANVMLPMALVTLLASSLWLKAPAGPVRSAVGQMLIFAWAGLLGSFIQIRLNMVATPALPFLAGFAGAEVLRALSARRSALRLAGVVLLGLATFAVQGLSGPVYHGASRLVGYEPPTPLEKPSFDKGCRTEAQLAPLANLPAARILTTLNLGAPMILTTHHSALSVPYQRGAHTFWNGTFPFRTKDLMAQAIRQSAPDYVVICRKAAYDATHAFAIALRDGQYPAWLQPVDIGSEDLLLLQVRPEALPAP